MMLSPLAGLRWLLIGTLLLSPMSTVRAAAVADAAGQARPSLVIETLDHGTFDLASKAGKWVVVNFWATWCAPCLKELPDFSAFNQQREDVEVIGLAFEEIEPAAMRVFLQARPVSYPIAIVDVYQPPMDWAVPRGLPMTYLIDPQGVVAKRFLGPVTSLELAAVIDAATPAQAADGR
jgi:thiol-disulfide isomerase/thioredoxin